MGPDRHVEGDGAAWERPGMLSIVVQGALSGGTIVELARHCRHWRDQFPFAQIILAISVTDLLEEAAPGILATPRLIARHCSNGVLAAALSILTSVCDVLVQAEPELALPPIKSNGERPNHVNFQIAAAKAGLAEARGRFTMRTRGDLVFADRSFLDQYAEGMAIPRGPTATLRGRVLVSSLYTLNPFTHERMPFHVSDWFHFGRTEDVRALWNVPAMTFADAVHFQTHVLPNDAQYEERLILTRVADEQHILFHCFKDRYPGLRLAFAIDPSSIDAAIDILADELMVCDMVAARCLFDKYQREFLNPEKAIHCVTREDWLGIARTAGIERRQVLARKAGFFRDPATKPFPRHYPAAALSTTIGRRSRGSLFACEAGVLSYGPYDLIGPGSYVACVSLQPPQGAGTIGLRVTAGPDHVLLADRSVRPDQGTPAAITLPFDVPSGPPIAFEVITTVRNFDLIALSGLTIEQRGDGFPPSGMTLPANSWPMQSAVGRLVEAGVATTTTAGYLLFGPYTHLRRGRYRVAFALADGITAGGASVDIAAKGRTLSSVRIRPWHLRAGEVNLKMHLEQDMSEVEFRVKVGRRSSFEVHRISVTETSRQ